MGASLGGTKIEHHCPRVGSALFLEGVAERQPWMPPAPAPAWRERASTSTHRGSGSPSLTPHPCLVPAPFPCPRCTQGCGRADPEAAPGSAELPLFPKARCVPRGSLLAGGCREVFTFPRTMPYIPQSSSSGSRDRANPGLQPDLQVREITVTISRGFLVLLRAHQIAQRGGIEAVCPLAPHSQQRQNYCLINCSESEQDLRAEPALLTQHPGR